MFGFVFFVRKTTQIRCLAIQYQSSQYRDLKKRQREFPSANSKIFIPNQEVKCQDGFGLIDKPEQPHELHLVKKIKKIRDEPWWVRKALNELGFDVSRRYQWDVVYRIVPNTKEINDILWLCKHMVKVTPVKFKNGYPSDKDAGNIRIDLEKGELEIIKPFETFDVNGKECYQLGKVPVTEELQTSSSFPIDKSELTKNFRRTKELCRLNDEHFPAIYDYKYDNDKPGVRKVKGRPDTMLKEDEITN